MSARQGHIADFYPRRVMANLLSLTLEAGSKVSAIDGQDGTRHIRAGIRTHQQERTLEFRQLSDAALWNPVNQLLADVTRKEISIEIRLDISRTERIDPDVVTGEFKRHGLGQVHDAGL